VGDISVTVGTAGPKFDVELVSCPDVEFIELEAGLIHALGHLRVAAQTVGTDPLRLGHKPLPISLVEELMGLAVAIYASHLREGGMDQRGDPAIGQAPLLAVAGETVLRAGGGVTRQPSGQHPTAYDEHGD